MENKKRLLTLTLGLLCTSASAWAYFDFIPEEKADPVTRISTASTSGLASTVGLGVTQVGTGLASQVSGRVLDTKMVDALPLLIPKGWRVKMSPGLSNRTISWVGGKTWLSALDDSLRQAGLGAQVNWRDHTIAISGAGSASASPRLAASNVKSKAAAPGIAQKVWTVKSGQTVQEILSRWTSDAGWSVEANSGLTVMADVKFKGSIKSAVRQLVQALNASNSDVMLRAKFYSGNNYLRVWEANK